MIVPAADGAPARWGVDFWVADAAEAVATTQQLGGVVLAAPYDVPPFRQAPA